MKTEKKGISCISTWVNICTKKLYDSLYLIYWRTLVEDVNIIRIIITLSNSLKYPKFSILLKYSLMKKWIANQTGWDESNIFHPSLKYSPIPFYLISANSNSKNKICVKDAIIYNNILNLKCNILSLPIKNTSLTDKLLYINGIKNPAV